MKISEIKKDWEELPFSEFCIKYQDAPKDVSACKIWLNGLKQYDKVRARGETYLLTQ